MLKNLRPLLFSTVVAAFAFGLTACDSDPEGPGSSGPDANGNQQMNDQGSTGSFNEGDPPTSTGGYNENSQSGSGGS